MPSPARNGELVGHNLGKYELLALIAVGGTAEIYLARISGASGFEKYLVVKCLLDHLADDQEFVRMFLDEARVGAQLDHSNIVQTLELGEHDGRYFLVMEYLPGMSVAQMARKTQERGINGGLMGTNLVLGLASQTCNGLYYAHSKTVQGKSLNLVHRDISPQNLVVSYEGILKIVDFGIAKSDIREAQTKTGTIKGKFAYMSPEQCLAKKVDHRTDIFALGTLTHELLTGRRLFKRQTTYDTYQAIVAGGVPEPSSINHTLDSQVDEVIMKALAYKPEDRFQDAQEFGEAILSLLHQRSGSGAPSEVSRFFDDNFGEDLEAHARQMRELITGRAAEVPEGSWDSEFGNADTPDPGVNMAPRTKSPPETRPVTKRKATARHEVAQQPNATSGKPSPPKAPLKLDSIPDIAPQSPDPVEDLDEDDDEGPTRIEFNPGDKIAAFHEESSDVNEADIEASLPDSQPQAQAASLESAPIEPSSVPGAGPQDGLPLPMTSPQPPSSQPAREDPAGFAAPPETINISSPLAGMPPLGQGPQGQNPLGQGQAPMGQGPQGQNPLGQGQAPMGQGPQGQNPLGQDPLGQGPQGQDPMGAPYSQPGAAPLVTDGAYQTPSAGYAALSSPRYPAASMGTTVASKTPVWMHALVFAAFAGLGIGVAAVIKTLL